MLETISHGNVAYNYFLRILHIEFSDDFYKEISPDLSMAKIQEFPKLIDYKIHRNN